MEMMNRRECNAEAEIHRAEVDKHNRNMEGILLTGCFVLSVINLVAGMKLLPYGPGIIQFVETLLGALLAQGIAMIFSICLAQDYLTKEKRTGLYLVLNRILSVAGMVFFGMATIGSLVGEDRDAVATVYVLTLALGNFHAFVMPFFKRKYEE